MDKSYLANYYELHTSHWWWRAREKLILRELDALRPEGNWGNILDVGCGDGLFFGELSKRGTVEGVEPEASLVSTASAERIHVAPFDKDFEPGKQFGLVLMLDVLEHLPDPRAALQRAVELLTPGGILLLTVPAFNVIWTSHDELNHHQTRYTKRSLTSLAAEAGVHIDGVRYFFHWLFVLKFGVRTWEWLFRARPQPPTVPPRPLNWLLYQLARAEQELCRAIRLPFGSSLLVIGKASAAAQIRHGRQRTERRQAGARHPKR